VQDLVVNASAVQFQREDAATLKDRGLLLIENKHILEALDCFDRYLQSNPLDFAVHNFRGNALKE
jgi:Flp pilus assembly protein TadD